MDTLRPPSESSSGQLSGAMVPLRPGSFSYLSASLHCEEVELASLHQKLGQDLTPCHVYSRYVPVMCTATPCHVYTKCTPCPVYSRYTHCFNNSKYTPCHVYSMYNHHVQPHGDGPTGVGAVWLRHMSTVQSPESPVHCSLQR